MLSSIRSVSAPPVSSECKYVTYTSSHILYMWMRSGDKNICCSYRFHSVTREGKVINFTIARCIVSLRGFCLPFLLPTFRPHPKLLPDPLLLCSVGNPAVLHAHHFCPVRWSAGLLSDSISAVPDTTNTDAHYAHAHIMQPNVN